MNKIRKPKTSLNKRNRIAEKITVNSRRYENGDPIEYAIYTNNNGDIVEHLLDTKTENGGSVTPFNILCTCVGACAIRDIIFKGETTIVLFADGDKVVLNRHSDDKPDRVTAVLWALGQKLFGVNLARQINNAIKYRGRDVVSGKQCDAYCEPRGGTETTGATEADY